MDSSFTELFSPLCFQLDRADTTYRNYLNRGQTFLYASILYECNFKIRELIFNKTHLIPDHLKKEFLDLVEYLDIWISLWQSYREKLKPQLENEFTFKNEFSFPRDSCKKIEYYFNNRTKINV